MRARASKAVGERDSCRLAVASHRLTAASRWLLFSLPPRTRSSPRLPGHERQGEVGRLDGKEGCVACARGGRAGALRSSLCAGLAKEDAMNAYIETVAALKAKYA